MDMGLYPNNIDLLNFIEYYLSINKVKGLLLKVFLRLVLKLVHYVFVFGFAQKNFFYYIRRDFICLIFSKKQIYYTHQL